MSYEIFSRFTKTLVSKFMSGNVLHIPLEIMAGSSLREWLLCGKCSHLSHLGSLCFNNLPGVHFSVLLSW